MQETSRRSILLKDRRLPADTANGPAFFQAMLDAVKAADGVGFSWCNETPHAVMAALGVDENGAVTTRGWYRVDAGKCVKPDVPAKLAKLYSFAEAVDKEGQALKREKNSGVGGATRSNRDVRFEIEERRIGAGKASPPPACRDRHGGSRARPCGSGSSSSFPPLAFAGHERNGVRAKPRPGTPASSTPDFTNIETWVFDPQHAYRIT